MSRRRPAPSALGGKGRGLTRRAFVACAATAGTAALGRPGAFASEAEAVETAFAKIFGDQRTDRMGPIACADKRNALGAKEGVQVAGGHRARKAWGRLRKSQPNIKR